MKKRNLLFTVIAIFGLATIATSQVPTYVPTNGLVGWWSFNANANDESGNGNNGTVNGATLTSDRNENINSAYYFDGNDDIPCGYNSSLNITNNYSISYWYKKYPNASSVFSSILSKDNGGGAQNKYIFGDNYNTVEGDFLLRHDSLGISTEFHANNVIDTNWNFILWRFSNNIIELYRNGQLLQMFNLNSPFPEISEQFFIGSAEGGFFWIGKIDDIGIWNRDLTQAEITALYEAKNCSGLGTITADGPTTFCAGNYVYLTSDITGGTYQWKKNGVNISNNSTSRTYKAKATGSYTCVSICSEDTITSNAISLTSKENASALLSAAGPVNFCAGDSVTLNATNLGSNYSVQWYRANISIDGATAFSQVVKQPGTYKVVTENIVTGCSRISGTSVMVGVNCRMANPDVATVNVINDEYITNNLGDDISEKHIYIFPNPSEGSFTLEYAGELKESAADLQILNAFGKTIYETQITTSDGLFQQQINLGNTFQKGIYLIRLNINGDLHDSKVMLQ